VEYYISYLLKAENPEAYKKLAEEGIMVGFSAKVAGQTHRPDNGIPYHSTVKFFDPSKDHPDQIHSVASKLKLTPPDAKNTRIEPGVFKDRMGNDVYVIKLHGPHADEIKGHNAKFSHMGYPANYEYSPHVSVDKQTWDKIVATKAQTAHDAGIEFGPAQLKQGQSVLHTYPHLHSIQGGINQPVVDKEKLAASEDTSKGILHQLGTAAVMAGAIATATPTQNAVPSMYEKTPSSYSSQKMLSTIAQVESSGGKFANHRSLGGMHQGEKAYGKFGLTPTVIRETIKMHSELKNKHKKATALQGDDLHRYMQDNPGLEDAVANKHLKRLEHHFGQDPTKIGYAWLSGITGTYKAKKENVNLDDHWHVKKINKIYAGGK
jgi:hypothetical protein